MNMFQILLLSLLIPDAVAPTNSIPGTATVHIAIISISSPFQQQQQQQQQHQQQQKNHAGIRETQNFYDHKV